MNSRPAVLLLLTLTMTKGTEAYDLADILVAANLPGQTATAVNFTHTDANGNGKLDKGDSLVCKEPPVNLFDATTVGKSVKVALTVKRSGSTVLTSLASETWVPAN